jgi:hypothetical protein
MHVHTPIQNTHHPELERKRETFLLVFSGFKRGYCGIVDAFMSTCRAFPFFQEQNGCA